MKKIIMFTAAVMLAIVTNAATVAWSAAGMAPFANNSYDVFIIGQNGVTSVSQITALLDAGKSVDSYAFGSGTVASNGTANNTNSGKELAAGTYTSFMVLFDDGKYVTIDGIAKQTQTFTDTAAKVTFAANNVSSIVGTSSAGGNWKTVGPSGDTPEPTSGLLLLVGAGMLALRRKQK